jgi:hypothetical protein
MGFFMIISIDLLIMAAILLIRAQERDSYAWQ